MFYLCVFFTWHIKIRARCCTRGRSRTEYEEPEEPREELVGQWLKPSSYHHKNSIHLILGMFVIDNIFSKKGVKHCAAKIIYYYGHWEFEISYLRKKDNGWSLHFPSVLDEASVNVADVEYIVEPLYIKNRRKMYFSDKNIRIFYNCYSIYLLFYWNNFI